MRRESSNEIQCNIWNSTVLQHTKNNISLTKQISGFYSIHFRQLWYWDNITRIFLVTIKTRCNSCIPKQCRGRLKRGTFSLTNTTELLDNLQASKIGPRGNAGSKQRLIISNEEKLLHSEEKQKKKKKINKFWQQDRGFVTTAMRSSYAFTHARMRSASGHHLHVWEHGKWRNQNFVSELTSGVSRCSSHFV